MNKFLALLSLLTTAYFFILYYFPSLLPRSQGAERCHSSVRIFPNERWGMIAIVVIAAVLTFHGVTRELSYDESFTAVHFVDVDSLWKTMSTYIVFNNHILYSILARFSQRIFGHHEWALRLPAMLLGMAGIYSLWFWARITMGRRVAIASAFYLAVAPFYVNWCQSARGYTGLIFAALVSSYYYFKILDYNKWTDVIKFISANVMGIYFHLYALSIVMVQGMHSMYLALFYGIKGQSGWQLNRKSFYAVWISFAAILVVSLLCYAPVARGFNVYFKIRSRGEFKPWFPLELISQFSGDVGYPVAVILFVVFLIGIGAFVRQRPRDGSYFVMLFLVPVTIAWLARPLDLHVRFFAFLAPFYIAFFVNGFFVMWDGILKRTKGIIKYSGILLLYACAIATIVMWCEKSWQVKSGWGLKEAVAYAEHEMDSRTALAAIGMDAELSQYYAGKKVILLSDLNAFQRLTSDYMEVRCLYRKEALENSGQGEIADYFHRNAQTIQFRGWVVYLYRR